jgi:deoxyhypusine monooxygenase
VALARLEWLDRQKNEKNEQLSQNPYYSVDPAPPAAIKDLRYLKDKLLDESESMFERYRYLFKISKFKFFML